MAARVGSRQAHRSPLRGSPGTPTHSGCRPIGVGWQSLMTETYGGAMGVNQNSRGTNARCVPLHDVVGQYIRMRQQGIGQMSDPSLDCLAKAAQITQASLTEAYQQQLESLEAFEMLLTILAAAPEKQLRSGGLMYLLAPLVKKLGTSVGIFSSIIS